jgi:hypothetical protein
MAVLNRYERVIQNLKSELEAIALAEQVRNNVIGEVGIRDRMYPCEWFDYGPATGTCWSDGHYMCCECKELDPNQIGYDD